MNEDKRKKEQGNLLSSETQPKIEHNYEKDNYAIKIYLLFFTAIFFISITMNTLPKYEGPKTKDIIFSLDYCDTKMVSLNFGGNCLGTEGHQDRYTTLSPLLFSEFSRGMFIKSLLPSRMDNALCFLTFIGNDLFCKDFSLMKFNYDILNKLSNIDKTKDDNNLEIYKQTKIDSSFRKILNQTILNDDVLNLSFYKDNCCERREEKRRAKIVPRGARRKQIWT